MCIRDSLLQSSLGLRTDFGAGQYSRQRCLGLSVNPSQLALGALLALQFETGVKEVEQGPVGFLDHDVDQFHYFRIVVPLIPKTLSDMGVILLLDMGIVIF